MKSRAAKTTRPEYPNFANLPHPSNRPRRTEHWEYSIFGETNINQTPEHIVNIFIDAARIY
jgi:hypothetical protein